MSFCCSRIRSESTLMSISAGWDCSTSATILSWPANTWQSCSLRLAVSSGLLSAPEGPKCPCWSHSCPCSLPLPLLPLCAAPRAPPSVRSRKFRTSVWERGGLVDGKVVATPAKEWFPGSGFLRENKEFNSGSRQLYICSCLLVSICMSVWLLIYLCSERRKSFRWGPPLPKGSSGTMKRSPTNVYWRSLRRSHYCN